MLRRNVRGLPRTGTGQEFACRPPVQHGVSNSVTGRNRCAAKDFCLVPKEDMSRPVSESSDRLESRAAA
jgi:hypothetical protein